jgi:acetyltransferase-like isoleucine patch superfamily enzyme
VTVKSYSKIGVKLKYWNHFFFPLHRCWNIRIRSGFEISQFPLLSGRLQIMLGANVTIEKDVWLKGSGELKIGDRTLIGRRNIVGCNHQITIGCDCLLAENVSIRDTDH